MGGEFLYVYRRMIPNNTVIYRNWNYLFSTFHIIKSSLQLVSVEINLHIAFTLKFFFSCNPHVEKFKTLDDFTDFPTLLLRIMYFPVSFL